MDLGAGLADVAAHALCLQAGVIVALALALAAAFASTRRQAEARAAEIAAENDSLRNELWGLKEAASARDRAEVVPGMALRCAPARRRQPVSRDTVEPVAWQGFRVGGDADEPAGVAQLGRASAL